jgi:virginiamycin B lyase
MNNVPFVPRSPAGRKIHNLARRHVRDDHDLRDAVHRALAERRGSVGQPTDGWTRPSIDTRRRLTPPTTADQESDATMQPINGTPADVPTPIQDRRWLREALKLVAAAIVIALVGTLLVLLLRDNDPDDQSSVPGVAPAATSTSAVVAPTEPATSTVAVVAPTIPASPTVDRVKTAQAAQTATASSAAATQASSDVTDGISATIPVPGEVQGIAATDGAIWAADAAGGTVVRIDPATNTIVATVQISAPSSGGPNGSPLVVVSYNNQVWVTNNSDNMLARIDPATNTVVQTIAVDPGAVVVDETGIWIADDSLYDSPDGMSQILHIDPTTGAVLASIAMPTPNSLASGFGSIWVMTGTDQDTFQLMRVDEATETIVNEIQIDSPSPVYVATGAGSVWVSSWESSTITRIDPTTNTIVATIDSGLGTGHAMLVTDSALWVSSIFSSGVAVIDPATNQPVRTIDMDRGGSVGMAEFSDGSIWVTHYDDGVIVRIDTAP